MADQITPSFSNAPSNVSLVSLAFVFFHLGATTFGGMWGAMQRLEDELVQRRGWLSSEEQKALMVAATLIPAPKFLAFGGMVGFRLRGWLGSVVSLVALLTPPSVLAVVAVAFLTPEVVGEAIVPVQRTVGIAIVGLLFANGYVQLISSKVRGLQWVAGVFIAIGVAGATLAGLPLVVSGLAGFVIGALLIRDT